MCLAGLELHRRRPSNGVSGSEIREAHIYLVATCFGKLDVKRLLANRRRKAAEYHPISLGAFALHKDGCDCLIVLPRPIAHSMGMVPGQRLLVDVKDGELKIRLPASVRHRSLLRASAGWPSIRRALRSTPVRRG